MVRFFALCVLAVAAADAFSQDTVASQTKTGDDAIVLEHTDDPVRDLQSNAISQTHADWGRWGHIPDRYSTWTNHSNRLIPVYTFGITLDTWREAGSVYANPQRLEKLYGSVPAGSVNPTAVYYDQSDVFQLQQVAFDAGCTNIILMVFDGMDWQTTRAAAIYKTRRVGYERGRGTGLSFQDFRGAATDFSLVCTSSRSSGAKLDVNAQTVISTEEDATGGYDFLRGGRDPWSEQSGRDYLLGLDVEREHYVTDSASSATSMTCGIKTYNGGINVDHLGNQLIPLGRKLQDEQDFLVGVVTSVPVSHATPAAAYANNVTRKDYQDIARDLVGLPSSAHRDPLPGVDVLIGGGWGEHKDADELQGDNFMPGNPYFHEEDIQRVSLEAGGRYLVARRTTGQSGAKTLLAAAQRAADEDHRLLGFYGVKGGHLPFQTADGKYNPAHDMKGIETYTPADVTENPTLAEMTGAALLVLEQAIDGFWLMIEAGDVDWANHANNIDSSIGAVLSGEAAFDVVMEWIDENDAWGRTAVIVTADHGHYLVIEDAQRLAVAGREASKYAKSGSKSHNSPVHPTR